MPMIERFKKFTKKQRMIAGAALVCVILLLRYCMFRGTGEGPAWQIAKTEKVERGTVEFDISSTGEVKPQNRLELKPPISGRVERLAVREGDQVKKGDVLAELSSTERAALLDAAHARGAEAVSYWREVYRATPLMSPIDGTVIVRSVEPGQTVTASDPIVVISDRLIVKALVNETDIGHIKVGQTATIVLDAYPELKIPARVDHVAYESILESNVNIYHVDVVPAEEHAVFRSGMTSQVLFHVDRKDDVLRAPAQALIPCPKEMGPVAKKNFCAAVSLKEGAPVWKQVEVGLSNGVDTEIVSGLKENDTVLILRKSVPQTPVRRDQA